MPACYFIRRTAKAWNVPPWVVSGEEPTRAVVSRWYFRERFFQSAEG